VRPFAFLVDKKFPFENKDLAETKKIVQKAEFVSVRLSPSLAF
jgi:hypothetical protein